MRQICPALTDHALPERMGRIKEEESVLGEEAMRCGRREICQCQGVYPGVLGMLRSLEAWSMAVGARQGSKTVSVRTKMEARATASLVILAPRQLLVRHCDLVSRTERWKDKIRVTLYESEEHAIGKCHQVWGRVGILYLGKVEKIRAVDQLDLFRSLACLQHHSFPACQRMSPTSGSSFKSGKQRREK